MRERFCGEGVADCEDCAREGEEVGFGVELAVGEEGEEGAGGVIRFVEAVVGGRGVEEGLGVAFFGVEDVGVDLGAEFGGEGEEVYFLVARVVF